MRLNFKVERTIDVMTLNSDNTVVEDKERTNSYFDDNVPAGTSLSELARMMNYHTKFVIFIDVNGIITDQTQESLL